MDVVRFYLYTDMCYGRYHVILAEKNEAQVSLDRRIFSNTSGSGPRLLAQIAAVHYLRLNLALNRN